MITYSKISEHLTLRVLYLALVFLHTLVGSRKVCLVEIMINLYIFSVFINKVIDITIVMSYYHVVFKYKYLH